MIMGTKKHREGNNKKDAAVPRIGFGEFSVSLKPLMLTSSGATSPTLPQAGEARIYELVSKLLVSPLITTTILPNRIPNQSPLKEVRP